MLTKAKNFHRIFWSSQKPDGKLDQISGISNYKLTLYRAEYTANLVFFPRIVRKPVAQPSQ